MRGAAQPPKLLTDGRTTELRPLKGMTPNMQGGWGEVFLLWPYER